MLFVSAVRIILSAPYSQYKDAKRKIKTVIILIIFIKFVKLMCSTAFVALLQTPIS